MRTVGIVGAGHLGEALATRLVAIGYAVRLSNSRGRASLAPFAERTGAVAADLADVARGVDFLILAIPFGRAASLPGALLAGLPADGVVVDAGNYVPPRDGAIPEIDAGLAESAWTARRLGTAVVKAFNNITDHSLEHGGRPEGARDRIALPVAGDDATKRAAVMRLVRELGFDAHDAGPLAESWRQQIGQPAYCTDPTAEQLPRLLARADRETVTRNRVDAMKLLKRMPQDFSKPDLVRAARFMVGIDRGRPASWLSLLRLGWAMLRRR